ncbi:MAG: hypothetical protein H7249_17515 [Chitinophagaceae bacterium]|nr:hypothetical protein [Oligoflexus sp.]
MRARSLLLILPLLWIVLTAFTAWSGHPWSSNHATLNRTGDWVTRFQKAQGRLPETLAEVRTYAYSHGQRPDLHDSYGHALFYQPLTEEAFVLKSFGRDAMENTVLISRDESYGKGIAYPASSLRGETMNESVLNFYQSSFLEGVESSRGSLVASLKSRFRGGSKRLLIQSHDDPEFFMISTHDAVEEFLWLPGGFEIIFTASGSKRYDDGLYYWNLTDNHIVNLLPKVREKFFPRLSAETKITVSLSHVSDAPNFIYFFAMPFQNELDPKEFYRYHNFYAFNPRSDFAVSRVTADEDYAIFDYPINHDALIDHDTMLAATSSQKDWIALTLSGDKQKLLETWQAYCTNHSDSPALPYSLWWLASLYNDTYRELHNSQPQKARIIRNYGLEIIEALSALPSTPLYLRGFSEHLKKNLLLSKPADYNVATQAQEPNTSAPTHDQE